MKKNMLNAQIKYYVETEIIPLYENFDKAHNYSHVKTVIEESLVLANNYDVNIDMVYVIAAYHDTGLVDGREFHHLKSGEIIYHDNNLRKWFEDFQMLIMREAVEDHRASANQEPRTIYGKIVAEADRIIDVDVTLRRTILYGLKNYSNGDIDFHYKRFCEHLTEKYADGGYLKLWIPFSNNAKKLGDLRKILTDENLLRQKFNDIYNEEILAK